MSKSHESHGRGGLPRHKKTRPARQGSGRHHKSSKQGVQGTRGLQLAPLLPTTNFSSISGPRSIIDGPVKSEPRASGFVSMVDLKEAVIQPGIEKHLQPLLLYRGSMQMGRIKRLWNYLQLMKLAGSRSASEGVKLFQNPSVPHLLGPAAKNLPSLSLETFLSRMYDHMGVAANIPGLPEYIRDQIAFRKFNLTQISTADRRSKLDFRRQAGEVIWKNRTISTNPKEIFYPFMVYDPQDDSSELVKFINAMVPRGLIGDVRADVCQEMLLAILTGEISRDEAHSKRHDIIKRVYRMNGINDGALRLDAPLPGHSKTLIEILIDSEWVGPECDEENSEEENFVDDRTGRGKLYSMRIAAHAVFDRSWQRNRPTGLSPADARDLTYRWLARQLGMSLQDCHIGQFDIELCQQVIDICEEYENEHA